MTKTFAALFTGMFLTSIAAAQDDLWLQDFAAAKAKAKAENKHLLLDFTGSDWCIWCKRLDGEVFSTDAFKQAAPKDFILVKLDYPNDESLVTAEVKEQNARLQTEYAVEGYPTVLLTDADGRPFAKTGYQPGGAEAYLPHLAELKQQKTTYDAAMLKAKELKGGERATALHAALSALDEELVLQHYKQELDELLALDADGKAGVKAKWDEKIAEHKVKQQIQELQQEAGKFAQAGEWDKLIARMDEIAKPADAPKHLKQFAVFFKGIAIMESTGNADAAAVELKKAKEIDAESEVGQQIDGIIEQMKEAAKQKKGGEEKGGK